MSLKKLILVFTLTLSSLSFAQTLSSSTELLEAVKKNPGDNNLYFQYGISLSREHKDNEAIVVFDKLLTIYPQSSSIYNNLAVIYARQKNFDKTEELLKSAIKYSPNTDTAYENIADLYSKLSALNYQKAYEISNSSILVSKIDGLNKVLELNKETLVENKNVKTTIPVEKLPVSNSIAIVKAEPKALENKIESKTVVADQSSLELQEITKFLNDWKKTWENKDYKNYISFYNYTFSGNTSFKSWIKQRISIMSAQKNIQITLSDIKVEHSNNDVIITFNQKYSSDSFSSVENMQYLIKKIDNQWKFIKKF